MTQLTQAEFDRQREEAQRVIEDIHGLMERGRKARARAIGSLTRRLFA